MARQLEALNERFGMCGYSKLESLTINLGGELVPSQYQIRKLVRRILLSGASGTKFSVDTSYDLDKLQGMLMTRKQGDNEG